MNVTDYFLKHPVSAIVLNALIVVLGLICYSSLTIREYPAIDFPNINIHAYYPGASAELVETSVTNILEDVLGTINGLRTIISTSKDATSSIKLTFDNNISIDEALNLVQELVSKASSRLPKDVKPPIIERKTGDDGAFMIISIKSDNMDAGDLTHYANLHYKNFFRTIKSIANVEIWGQYYNFQIKLDQQKMYRLAVDALDVFTSLKRANFGIAAGKYQNQVPISLNGELLTISDYEDLIIKRTKTKNKSVIFLKNIAEVKFITDDQNFRVRLNGKPAIAIGIYKNNDANALDVSNQVLKAVEELKKITSSNIEIDIILDDADFIRSSLKNIRASIVEAIILVIIIVFIFLGNLKATIIPLITIPISLTGSFLLLKIFGFSINIITLLAMVLSVGLVVDDAIIVLENIQRFIEKGYSPFEAASRGARQIGFAIIAMTLTLATVYVPFIFITSSVGDLFIEFAVALGGSVIISGIVALTISPLMCTVALEHSVGSKIFTSFNRFFDLLNSYYSMSLNKLIHYKKLIILIITLNIALIFLISKFISHELAPPEDRSLIGAHTTNLSGYDSESINKKIIAIENILSSIDERKFLLAFINENMGNSNVVVPLKPMDQRSRSSREIIKSLEPTLSKLPSIDCYTWSNDSGLPMFADSSDSSTISLAISSQNTYRDLFDNVSKLLKIAQEQKLFSSIRQDLKMDTANYKLNIDMYKLSVLNITLEQIGKAVEIFFSGNRNLTFSKDAISYSILLQGNKSPWSLSELYVMSRKGKPIALSSLATMTLTSGPKKLYHHNQMRSTVIDASLHKGENLKNAMDKLLNLAKETLPPNYKKMWIGSAQSYLESQASIVSLFLLALIFIFAILSVQFQSFIDPLIILVTVPLACFGALGSIFISGQSFNIYTQVGLVTLVGLITKHGILIVDFANELYKENNSWRDSVIEATKLRFRPIIMTSLAMIFGSVPLILFNTAGYEARRSIGTVLIGGLTIGTIFTLFILPSVYLMVKSYFFKKN